MQSDPNLLRMLNLGEYHSNNHHINISMEMKNVQSKVHDFPSIVKVDLEKNVESIEKSLAEIQSSVQLATQNLAEVIYNMVKKVDIERENIEPLMQRLQEMGDLLWGVSLSTALTVLCISLLLSIGLMLGTYSSNEFSLHSIYTQLLIIHLGIIHAERAAKFTFILSAVLFALGSFGLAGFTIVRNFTFSVEKKTEYQNSLKFMF